MIRLDRRVLGEERMDAPGASAADLDRALDDLERVGRWLGGRRGIRRHLVRLLPPEGGPYRILDVGAGGGDLSSGLAADLAAHGVRVSFVGLDLHPTTIGIARKRHPRLDLVRGDARDLPFAAGSFDAAICAMTLHHFSDADAVRVLGEMVRISRRGVVVSDLIRSRASYLGARLLAGTLWRKSRLTRYDGPLSVRSAFRPRELRELAEAAGMYGVRVRREPVFRVALRWVRPA